MKGFLFLILSMCYGLGLDRSLLIEFWDKFRIVFLNSFCFKLWNCKIFLILEVNLSVLIFDVMVMIFSMDEG